MLNAEDRQSIGQSVHDTAEHYYAGLANISHSEAKQTFIQALLKGDPWAESALRLAEVEGLAGYSGE